MAFALKARWQNGQPMQSEANTADICACCRKAKILGFSKLKARRPRALTCSDETNPFVVKAIRRQIHSFILGTDK